MPLYSDHISNMYYSGSSYSAPYSYGSKAPHGSSYSSSYLNPGSSYSNHSSLGGYSRAPISSRWITSSGRTYSPILSTISERTTSSPSRITSPRRIPSYKRRFISSYTPRPININTADIDVSRNKYRPKAESPPPLPLQSDEPAADNENGPFMPRVDGKPETGIDSSPGEFRTTIKRGRTVVRLHTIKRKDRDSPRKPSDGLQKSSSEEGDKNESVAENIAGKDVDSFKWRDKLSDDLIYKDKKEKKTIGAKLMEKFILKDNNDCGVEIISDIKNKQHVTALSAPPTPQPSTSKSPTRRCSMEILAEQANVLDSLIKSENLSTATLDLSKVGVDKEYVDIKPKRNPLKTAKSENAISDRFRKSRDSTEQKHSTKRRSLKKSASGGRLDSITEFPKEAMMCSALPSIEEKRSSIKNESTKPKPKLKPKITSTVEISPLTSPLKFKIEEVTVEEKPRAFKKEISYSSTVDANFDEGANIENRSITNALRKSRMRSIRKTTDPGSNVPSPEPDDGNFWDKIGKRETVYLLKRKQNIEDTREKHRRALFWFPEDEASSANEDVFEQGNETKCKNNDDLTVSIEIGNETPNLHNNAKTNLADITIRQSIVSKECATPSGEIDNNMLVINPVKKADKPHLSPVTIEESNVVNEDPNISEDVIVNSKLNKKEDFNTHIAHTKVNVDNKNDTANTVPSIDMTCDREVEKKDALSKVSSGPQLPQIISNDNLAQGQAKISADEKDSPQIENFVNNKKEKIAEKDRESSTIFELTKPIVEDSIVPQTSNVNTKDNIIPKSNKLASEVPTTVPDKIKLSKQDSPKTSKNTEKICPVHGKKDNTPSKTEIKAESPKAVNTSVKHSPKVTKTEEKDEPAPSEQIVNPPHMNMKLESPIPSSEVSTAQNADSSLSLDIIKEVGKEEVDSQAIKHGVNVGNDKLEESSPAKEIPVIIESENIPNEEPTIKNEEQKRESEKAETNSSNKEKEERGASPMPIIKSPIKKPVKEELAVRPLIATPRPLQKKSPQVIHSSSSSSSSSEEEETSDDEDADASDTSEESAEFFECENNADGRTSTGSNDSGFDSSAPTSPAGFVHIKKDCDVNCHRKCEKLTANLCGVNQRLLVEALSSRSSSKKGGENPGTSAAAPAPNIPDFHEQELEQSTAYGLFRKTGRFTPPARSIPRFRKYNIEDFHFVKVLGKGSFGKVLLAELRDTEYYYAVKCLKKDVVLEDDDVECTLIERRVLALGTNHPYLCHLFATFQTDSHLFFVMEYLNGGDLMFHIQQSGRFPESRARFYAAEIVSGLKFLHKRGIVYRDLKLDNILLDFDGHVRIADFGMCKLQIYLEKTADTFCGTPDYMAPEIIKGLKYNQTVDWWSFGVLLYEMLIGQSPFSGCDEDELFWSICNEMPSYPRFLSTDSLNILTRLLDKDARTRLGGTECMHGDVRDQEFFHQIHWDRLERRELEAPFKPKVRHPLDTQYFDRAFTGERPRLTAVEPHVLRSMDQQPFRGFSYTNPNATDR